MHPNPAFRASDDRATRLDRVEAVGFTHMVAVTPVGAMVAHAPVTRDGERLRFHVARGNRPTRHLDGAVFRPMLGAITGFKVTPGAIRATTKLSQSKPAADRARVIAGLAANGNAVLAVTMAAAA